MPLTTMVRSDQIPGQRRWADLWREINQPRPFDHQPMRVGCAVLVIVYGLVAALRHHPEHPEFLWMRSAICAYALLGYITAGRLGWPHLRAWTTGLALLLPLIGSYVDGMLGNSLSQLPLTALATFVPLIFLQTGWDLLFASACLVAGNAALLVMLPAPAVAMSTIVIVIAGAIGTGVAACLVTLVYRARLHVSLQHLERALRTKSEFLSTMSHELRSPLHVIIGYTDIVRDEGVSSHAAHALDRVRASAVELLHLIENTMNAARLEAGKVGLRIEEFAPDELARDLAESVCALPEAGRGVGVRWEVTPGLPRVWLDRLKVKEIVQNLVSNALKFTPTGEVRVTMGRAGDSLRIAVRDTGVGIPSEAQGRIFEMFEREEGTAAGRAGVGLGLYIVSRLTTLMRGQAALESTPGAGSCFTIDLPLHLE